MSRGGIYVHVPWCRAICPYCSFDVVRDRGDVPWAGFVERVLAEREQRRSELPERPATLFFGGGTPSRMPGSDLALLVAGLEPTDGAEISVEVNPEDAGPEWLERAHLAGVTRVSIGVQSFHESTAKLLGRGHTSPQARQVIRDVASMNFTSWSADLIFAVPGQTLADLERDIEALLALSPPHVALYGLTFDEGTPFEARRRAGKLQPAPDGLWREMYDMLVDRLGREGLERYEVSNFARPGHRSRHNEGYWLGKPYLGLGPAAHGLGRSGRRWMNHADPRTWFQASDPTAYWERPTAREAATDRLVAGMRHVDGVDLHELALQTGHRPTDQAVERLCGAGLVHREGARAALTHAGFPIADSVVRAMVAAIAPVAG